MDWNPAAPSGGDSNPRQFPSLAEAQFGSDWPIAVTSELPGSLEWKWPDWRRTVDYAAGREKLWRMQRRLESTPWTEFLPLGWL